MTALFYKAILAGAILGSAGLIYHVHKSQEEERARLHEGVLRDLERQRYKEAARREKAIRESEDLGTEAQQEHGQTSL